MRNLAGSKFPNSCNSEELIAIMQRAVHACQTVDSSLQAVTGITMRERETMIAKRLISPEFAWQEPGRAVLLTKPTHSKSKSSPKGAPKDSPVAEVNPPHMLSVMVNEEDHLRVQMLSRGLELDDHRLRSFVKTLEDYLPFAHTRHDGYLASSVMNSGRGSRYSVLFQLIGLQLTGELQSVLATLLTSRITLRGAFGEGTKPIGSFLQVSSTAMEWKTFLITCEYLLEKELSARRRLSEKAINDLSEKSVKMIYESDEIDFPLAIRYLSLRRLIATNKHPEHLLKIDAEIECTESHFANFSDPDTVTSQLAQLRSLLELK